MACPDWPPPLPSLPLYPPCIRKQKSKGPPPMVPKNSSHQEWWDEYLGETLKRASGERKKKKSSFYELTSRQRRELLPVKIPTKQDKLIWSIPLPAGSYPSNGLPIWERLNLDHPLPMLKAPPDALVFARQQIGQKLWKDTEGQEFILYDPQGYEVQFSYENVHDPHLTNYYQGKEIRGFLLSMGDANADGWGICTLRRFNQYRKYLRRVHISLVHKQMEHQDIYEDELHRIKIYKQITKDTMEQNERKAMMDEAGAGIREALRQYRINRIKGILDSIHNKERRVKKLYKKRAKEQEQRIKKGQKLQAEQELKKKISNEINRRKKIATLRRWHEGDEKRMKFLRKNMEEKARQKAEKVRLKWQNKIDNMKKMFASQDEHLELQEEIKKRNVELRNSRTERIKKKQFEQFQELRKGALKKKALEKRRREDKKMADAIMTTWLNFLHNVGTTAEGKLNKLFQRFSSERLGQTLNSLSFLPSALLSQEYDLETEVYRVKKSINSTMAELLSQDTEGPDRYSIIAMARHRIQKEQDIPLQVSFAIEILLETSIEMWIIKRLNCLIETVTKELIKLGFKRMEEMKIKSKDIGVLVVDRNYKSDQPKGKIYKSDDVVEFKQKIKNGWETANSSRTTLAETEIKEDTLNNGSKTEDQLHKRGYSSEATAEITQGVIVNYVHFGPAQTFEYQAEEDLPAKLKPVNERPRTPMPSQKILCEAGFSEERLKDVLPAVSDVVTLKEKAKFRKTFKNTAAQLFKRAMEITERAYDPTLRIRTINKLIHLGDIERPTVVRTLCFLITNKPEKIMFDSEEFEWVSRTLGREVINEVLKPPEFQKVHNDGVARTKIMFYKPRAKNMK